MTPAISCGQVPAAFAAMDSPDGTPTDPTVNWTLPQYDAAMEAIAWATYNWTVNDSHLAALAPWHWYDDGRPGTYSYGVASLPRTQAAYTQIAALLKQKARQKLDDELPSFPNTTNGIHRFQVFDYRTSLPRIAATARLFDVAWGARPEHIATWTAAGKPGSIVSYCKQQRALECCLLCLSHTEMTLVPDNFMNHYSHENRMAGMQQNVTKEWLLQEHPEWVLYKCDRATPASAVDFPEPWDHVPLDLTSESALSWMFESMFSVAKRAGFSAIAMDGLNVYNYNEACGVFRDGEWVQLYDNSTADAAYTRDVLRWLARYQQHAHEAGLLVIGNTALNRERNPQGKPLLLDQVAPLVDGILDEWGFIIHSCGNKCNRLPTPDEMAVKVPLMRKLQTQGVALFPMAEWDAIPPNASAREWVVASYMLVKGESSAAYLAGVNAKGQTQTANVSSDSFVFSPEFSADVGHALAEPVCDDGVWTRSFSRGLSIVNPTKRAAAVPLDAGCSYRPVVGPPLPAGRTVTVPPQSARVLLRACAERGREIVALKSDDRLSAGLQWLAPFNPDWQTAVQSGLPRPTFQNVNLACDATLLERAYNQTGVPGFLSLENCAVPFGGIWRYYVSCDQHGHCIPINGTQSGLTPTWEHALQMILEPVLHLFAKGALVGVFLVGGPRAFLYRKRRR